VLQTTALDVRDGCIAAIYIVRNPDKLRHLVAAFGTDGHPPLKIVNWSAVVMRRLQ
jgi:RNA polymerase sigma-70 factor (ECF subfamily)